MVFADLRMKPGEHLRHLPMGYFTEGNVGKISSLLSTDMVFIEENYEMPALVGPSGGGKSTIASLLARLWDISDGEILIRGNEKR